MEKGVSLHPSAIEAVRVLITSDAWETFFKPAMEAMKIEWANMLMDPSVQRKDKYPDDYIRGCYETIDVLLRLPETLIAEKDANAERRERERSELRDYGDRADTGYVGPNFDDVDQLHER